MLEPGGLRCVFEGSDGPMNGRRSRTHIAGRADGWPGRPDGRLDWS